MKFYLLLLCGLAGGVLGGMGMGGGTALIPLLTLALGVEQRTAQAINLVSFLPMSALALMVHMKRGLVEKRALPLCFAPLPFSAACSLLALRLPSHALRTAFGAFLILSALSRLGKARGKRGRSM